MSSQVERAVKEVEAKSMYILAFNHDDVCRYSLIPEKLYEIQTFQTIGQAHFEQTCVATGLRAKERQ